MRQDDKINELIESLLPMLGADEGTVDEAIRRIIGHRMTDGGQAGVCAIYWLEDDVSAAASMCGIPQPSSDEAKSILRVLSKRHDGSYGVNWETIIDQVQLLEWGGWEGEEGL